MNLSDTVGSSFQNIFSHPLRSVMTLVAIIIGIFSVVVMFSTVYGLKTIIKNNMEELGWDKSVMIYPDMTRVPAATRRGAAQPFFAATPRQAKPLDYDDYLSLRQEVEHRYLYGVANSWVDRTSFAGRERVQVTATNADFFPASSLHLSKGRNFSSFEITKAAKVCILGTGLLSKYFAEQDVLDQSIIIDGNIYVVVGIVDEVKSGSGMLDFNRWQRSRMLNSVYIPLTTGIFYFKENKSVDYLMIQSRDDESYREMLSRSRQVLLANRNMSHDFRYNDIGSFIANIMNETEGFMKKWNITLTAIASISLLVGGLGLFSTMLISIGERLLEIGIRKSVGASPADIFFHFLLESLIFALMGAFIGIMSSTALIKILSHVAKVNFPVPIEGVLLGIGFAVLVGFLAGLYPAIKASELNPIQAIYYES